MGSFVCNNDNCPKFTSGKGRNTHAFTNIGLNLYECKTCGNVADRQFCGAMKLTNVLTLIEISSKFIMLEHILAHLE